MAESERDGGFDEFLFFQGDDLGACDACHGEPAECADGDKEGDEVDDFLDDNLVVGPSGDHAVGEVLGVF